MKRKLAYMHIRLTDKWHLWPAANLPFTCTLFIRLVVPFQRAIMEMAMLKKKENESIKSVAEEQCQLAS